MLAELSYLTKLWNRGVDIGVGVITSVLIAGIGLLFWRVKLWLDLQAEERKQRQQYRVAAEFEQARRQQEVREQHQRLVRQRENFAKAAASATTQLALAAIWESFIEWLRSNELQHLPANVAALSTHPRWSEGVRGSSDANFPGERTEMVRVIRNTELPAEE
jgi:hypothetical protein